MMARVADLGCCICGGEAEVHHLVGDGRGHGQKSRRVIPLCPRHHRNGNAGTALHAGVQTWEARFGAQLELWLRVSAQLGEEAIA